MTTKPPASPSLSMKPGVGPKKPPQAPQPQPTRVEASKLDPSVFGFGTKKSPEQELLENAEPITAPAPKQAPPPVQDIPEEPEPPKEKEKTVFEAVVTGSLLDSLIREYGLDQVKTYEANLEASDYGKALPVTFRALNWDDYNWGLGILVDMVKSPDFLYIKKEEQRNQLYKCITACRCVLKINGFWVWDLFEMTNDIKAMNPSWKGDTHVGIPSVAVSLLALKTFDLFKNKLHYNLLYALEQQIRETSDVEFLKEAEPEEDSDPT